MGNKQLSIILPSYNDQRIGRAIDSIRCFDDINSVRIVVIDGGSSAEVKRIIQERLSSDDVFVSEPDKGIFDALNKGLDACDTQFIGWLGSDDLFTGKVLASQVIAALDRCELFIANEAFFRDGVITRVTHALPARLGLVRYGINNPHFATFGVAGLLKSERFALGLRASDVEYFVRIFNRRPRVESLNIVATLREEGGFSNRSKADILRSNFELFSVYGRNRNWVISPLAVAFKLGYKVASRLYYRAFASRSDEAVQSLNLDSGLRPPAA